MKLAVIGTRTFTNKNRLYFELDSLRKTVTISEIVSGCGEEEKMNRGADAFARDYARDRGIKYKGFPADWTDMSEPCLVRHNGNNPYNALAGIKRNKQIAVYSDECLSFWDGISKGTRDCKEQFRILKKKVKRIIYPTKF